MKSIVIANWKMNPQILREASGLFRAVAKGVRGIKNIDVVIAPPFVYLPLLEVGRGKSVVALAAQDSFWEDRGAYTGEISPTMLKALGVTYVIIGHSERRMHLGETDEMVNKKIKAVLKAGLTPVLCVGERTRERVNEIPVFVGEQVKKALVGLKKGEFKNGVIAYEPVWAIGTGTPDTPEGATRAALYIRKIVRDMLGGNVADSLRVIYGGSVNAGNAASFISRDIRGMEGMLVGGASLKAEEFIEIVRRVSAQ
ncbi:MAG: triose-phosphate isomerase [bacterium]|nr:triose-phosphate isomerase [bacterium]